MRITLLRHAKSSWNNDRLSDKERPLNNRGRNDAPRMGKIVAERIPAPDMVIASTAQRVRETLELFFSNWPDPIPKIIYDEDLYQGNRETLFHKIKAHSVDHVLLCGHMPAIGNLAAWLCPGTNPDMSTTEIRSIVDGKIDFQMSPKDN